MSRPASDMLVCFQGAPGARGFPGADGGAGGKVSPKQEALIVFYIYYLKKSTHGNVKELFFKS